VCSRAQPVALTDDEIKVADGEAVVASARGTRQSGESLRRPVFDAKKAVGTAASVANAREDRVATGASRLWAVPNRPVRSQVANGAVKGRITRTTSQQAKDFGSIALGSLGQQSVCHVSQNGQVRQSAHSSDDVAM
jgi:hypothetical protein